MPVQREADNIETRMAYFQFTWISVMKYHFLAVITAARPWRVRDEGYPRLCLQKASHSHTPNCCFETDPRAFLKNILIWTVRFPGFEACIDKTLRAYE